MVAIGNGGSLGVVGRFAEGGAVVVAGGVGARCVGGRDVGDAVVGLDES